MAAPARLHIYTDGRGEYRWRVVSSNGRILADSGEGYQNRADLLHAVELIKAALDEE